MIHSRHPSGDDVFREPGNLPGGVSGFPGEGRDVVAAREIGEADDVVSLDEGEGETVSWIHGDTIPDPEGN